MSYEKGQWGHNENFVHGDTSAALNQTAWFLWWSMRVLLGQVSLIDQAGSVMSTTGFQDWTVAQSSNGVTASSGDNLHLTSGSFTAGDWVWQSSSGARSWVLISNARLGISLLIDCLGVSNAIHYYILYGTPTTGTTSAPPTATIMAGATNSLSFGIFDQTFGVTRKVHAHVAPDGSFFMFASKDGSGIFSSVLWLHKVTNIQSGDSYPWLISGCYLVGGVLRNGTGDFFAGSGTAPGGYGYDLTAAHQCPAIILNSTVNGNIFLSITGQNADGTWQGAYLQFWAGSNNRVKGRAQDWYLCPTLNGDGWLSPASPSAAYYCQVGWVLVPCRAAPLL